MKKARSLFMLGDSPTKDSGFGRVMRALAQRFSPHFDSIDVWGIWHLGWPVYEERLNLPPNMTLFPGSPGPWNGVEKMRQMLTQLHNGSYTQAFFLQDHFMFCPPHAVGNLVEQLSKAIDNKNTGHVDTIFYTPVDAAIEPDWLALLLAADHAFTYTKWGREELMKAYAKRLKMLPKPPALDIKIAEHGADFTTYKPLDRVACRLVAFKKWFPWKIEDTDLVLLNVNANQRRKGHVQCFQVLKALIELWKATGKKELRPRLVMHMPLSDNGLSNLDMIAGQFELERGVDWLSTDKMFFNNNPRLTDIELAQLYNAADAVITTSLGEGYGLSLAEGLACGTPVFCPDHTSCREIADEIAARGMPGRIYKLPVSSSAVVNIDDNSRVRWPVEPLESAQLIHHTARLPEFREHPECIPAVRDWMSWDRIADQFLAAWGIEKEVPVEKTLTLIPK